MEKRALIAIALSFFVMMFYWYMAPQQKQQPQQPLQQQVQTTAQPVIESNKVISKSEKRLKAAVELPKQEVNLSEEIIYLESTQLRAAFSTIGGSLKELEVKTYHEKNGNNIFLSSQENRYFPLGIFNLGDEDLRQLPFKVIEKTFTSIVFQAVTPKGIEVTKSIKLRPTQYLFDVAIQLRNVSKEQFFFQNGFEVGVGSILPIGTGRRGEASLGIDIILDNEPLRLSFRKVKTERQDVGNIKWAAVKNQFCAFILKPSQLAVGVDSWRFPGEKGSGLAASIELEDFSLVQNETKSFNFILYGGPKEYDTLKAIGDEFDKVMDFGKYLGPFSILILKSLNWIFGWCRNYGIAIILLTILIKVVTWPLTQKSFKSMKEMQMIQPQLTELREKYKSNPKKLQSEMMAMYKEHKINPLGGCFPLLLQMPILIAFFRTLNNAVELRGAPFCLWIKDLSAPDQLFILPMSLPVLGSDFNLLPLLMVATFVFQQKMSTAANKGMAITAQQQQQQKMMLVMMPVLFGFLFYNMPSGLVLYFTVSTLLGLLQQYLVLKQPSPTAKAKV